MTVDYDPSDPDVLADPTEVYEHLRERCPVHRFDGLEHPLWSLSRAEEVHRVLTDPATFPNRYGPGISYDAQNTGSLQRYDPPEHGRRRKLVRGPFLPTAVRDTEPRIRALAQELVAALAPSGRAELHDDYAAALPVTSFTEILGLPHEDHDRFKLWAEKVTLGMTYPEQAAPFWAELRAYVRQHLDERRARVAAGRDLPPGLLSELVVGRLDDGTRVTDEEATGLVSMMLVAGHETTASLIANAVWRLLEAPERWDRLVAEPELAECVIEESLRFDPPVLGICRTNEEEVELAGVTIPEGSKLMYLMRSANRDPERFDRPDEFVIDRPVRDNRRHYSFGWGPHFCLGATMARTTGRIALEVLVERLPGLRLDGPTERLVAPFLWGRRRLPVAWDRPA